MPVLSVKQDLFYINKQKAREKCIKIKVFTYTIHFDNTCSKLLT